MVSPYDLPLTPQTWDLGTYPSFPLAVLTSSGGHRSKYGWQVGSRYPIGMLSCLPTILWIFQDANTK